MRRSTIILLPLLLLALVPPPAAAASHTVTATNFQWTPATLTIAPGDSVTFQNGGGFHNVASAEFAGCEMPCTRTFPTEGAYDYVCGIHSSMTGTIMVGSPPAVTITSPASGATVQGIFTATGQALDSTPITKVEARIGSGPLTLATLTPIAGGVSWSVSLDSRSLVNGATTLLARATASDALAAETTIPLTIANPASVDLLPSTFRSGTSTTGAPTFILVLSNAGNAAAAGFDVTFQYLYKNEWRDARTIHETGLAAKTSATRNVAWDDGKLHVGKYPVRVVVDSGSAVTESNEANNVATSTATWYVAQASGVDPLEP